jgi:DNA-directed RNA polymerase subunit beta'
MSADLSLKEIFGEKPAGEEFDFVSICIASADRIRGWSSGEVKNPETINYRTFKPEKGGLFCERIFGPTRDAAASKSPSPACVVSAWATLSLPFR